MKIPVIGLDLDGPNLAVAQLHREDGELRISRVGLRTVPTQGFGKTLGQVVREMGFRGCFFAVGISSPEAIIRTFSLPRVSRKYLADAITLEAETNMLNGHSIEQMALDWCEVRQPMPANFSGILAAIPKDEIRSKLAVYRDGGICPSIVDVKALALWNAFWELDGNRKQGHDAVFFLNVGFSLTNLMMVRGRHELIMVRDLPIGASSYRPGQEWELFPEIEDSVTYARSKNNVRTIERICVTGPGSSSELVKELAAKFPFQVEWWNPLDFLRGDDNAAIDHAAGPALGVAIGLALREL